MASAGVMCRKGSTRDAAPWIVACPPPLASATHLPGAQLSCLAQRGLERTDGQADGKGRPATHHLRGSKQHGGAWGGASLLP